MALMAAMTVAPPTETSHAIQMKMLIDTHRNRLSQTFSALTFDLRLRGLT